MEFWLQKDNNDKFQLPVKPEDYKVSVSHKNTTVNVIKVGDVNLIGNTGLREISLSSFFPAKNYNFSNNSDRKTPLTYAEKLNGWRTSGNPIRVIITGTLNMECTIESFDWGEQDATGDIYFTLDLKEYKKIKTYKASKKSASSRSTKKSKKKTYKVKKGDTWHKIAKKFYGDGSKWKKIYKANKSKVKSSRSVPVGKTIKIP